MRLRAKQMRFDIQYTMVCYDNRFFRFVHACLCMFEWCGCVAVKLNNGGLMEQKETDGIFQFDSFS